MDKERQWQGKSGGGAIGQKALLWMFRRFDVRVGYAILYTIIPFYMLFARKGYRAIYHYFRVRMGLPPREALGATYRNHLLFGKIMLDRFAVFAGQEKQFRVEIDGQPLIDRVMADAKGCLLAGSHVGNFEMVGYLLHNTSKPTNAVIFAGEARVMQQNREQVLGQHNIRFVPVSPDMSHIFELSRAASEGEVLSIPCDRVFGGGRHVELDFLGGRAEFPVGGFVIAEKYDLNVVAIFVIKQPRGLYKVYAREIARDKAARMVESYRDCLEQIVKQYPHQWFNFYEFWNR